ncbi:hypothetical protein NDU88_002134 [Pleurodeles waltl]|uniref:RNase H type-1 domain-containing protein n=1 Tax=Pleurodeles waltl TaxID=8319 RepID=A0AAV7VAC1_PLEWA|nr:hypothetical protein NDU88_002134 [Pleurodeles waltl]
MNMMGVLLAQDKTEGPATINMFLGIELDSQKLEVRLPVEKVQKPIALLEEAVSKDKFELHQLQVLLDHLNFACRVACYVPGVNNDFADVLSRSQRHTSSGLALGADFMKTPLPAELWDLGM